MQNIPEINTFIYHANLLPTEILIAVVVVCLFVAGVYLQSKKIQVCWKEKDVTWKLEVTNSIILTLYWSLVIVVYGITYFVKNLHAITGEWFCFLLKILNSFGVAHSMGHSFFIAFAKLMVICHAGTDVTRKEKIKKLCFYLNILYGALVVGILNVIRPDYVFVYHSSMADRCLSGTGIISSHANTISAANLVQLCDIPEPTKQISFEYTLYVVRKVICWLDVSFIYLNAANILEAICYCRIFVYMHRYGN